ncbi:Cas10/Cmr2 second palm domain-containing protein [Sporomusa termitida]|uniref:Cas10/Cmr2 second palm domain-containing protein n=1 Tax=Sporomusa termitida TaxID=2377 RepID=A0A517DNG5_9FIRM|nr:hypothetical protein [Sporomusa termitida]QDR78903.1 hypothetical protein SPTER_01530 [Sporomusa termitida]
MAVYAYIDVARKQEFIYKNNKLRDNLHNSFIIKAITEELDQPERPEGFCLSAYLEQAHPGQFTFVYSGGGNSIIRFASPDIAEVFVKNFSREVLCRHPDLELYISLVGDDEVPDRCPGNDKQLLEKLHRAADKQKNRRRSRFRRWTYGVEKIDETGQAVRREAKSSPETKAAREYLKEKFQALVSSQHFVVTTELKDYQKAEEGKSYIGVIALDGNKMGEMVAGAGCFAEIKELSTTIEAIYKEAVREALCTCAASFREQGRPICITPVLMAGDDICLIAEAEHAIAIAAAILQSIQTVSGRQKQNNALLGRVIAGGYLTACAGVAIARYHYPFFELVQAAEGLCSRAKEGLYHVPAGNGSFIDWEVLQGPVPVAQPYKQCRRPGPVKEIFHVKPLRVDRSEPAAPVTVQGICHYDAFIDFLRNVRKHVSTSLLAECRKHFYCGWEPYRLFFESHRDSGKLTELAERIFGSHAGVWEHAVLTTAQEGVPFSRTYILPDILEISPFIAVQEEEAYGGNNLSDRGAASQ